MSSHEEIKAPLIQKQSRASDSVEPENPSGIENSPIEQVALTVHDPEQLQFQAERRTSPVHVLPERFVDQFPKRSAWRSSVRVLGRQADNGLVNWRLKLPL
uniref:Uncharacterized protein n=1 Tax=Fagus sylvatica TaxID=28930 RepID=A0A2N9I9P6_FAGSY